MTVAKTKSLDHIVLPVSSLNIARERLSALGFTVAPDGHHPFGTQNACVFFENGTYLEPLAIGEQQIYEQEADKGNGFLQRDRAYRQNIGDDGFSLIALTSEDAAAEREDHINLGFDCGPIVAFRRDVVQPDESKKQIAINLFITAQVSSPNLALFSCQWLSDKVFDPAHKVHANGASGIVSIAVAGGKDDTRHYFQALTGQSGNGHISDMGKNKLKLANGKINLLSDDELAEIYDLRINNTSTGPQAVAIDLAVSDLFYTAVTLRISGIASKQIGERLVVSPVTGQGYTIAFIQQNET